MENSELSTTQIFELALNEKDDDKRWEYIVVLHLRPTREVFEMAKSLCKSTDSEKICLGADVLAQLGTVDLPFKKETIPILMKLADSKLKFSNNEKDSDALQSVIIALSRMDEIECFKKITEFKNHSSNYVRDSVAFGISIVDEDFTIKALIELSDDVDEDVRNWATFGLGQSERDSREIRDAFMKRLGEKIGDEVCDEIRGEALVGLAIRKDPRVIEPLIEELSSKSVGKLAVEAASEIGDSRLCDVLLKLQEWWNIDEDLLKEAIKNCCLNQE